MKNELEEYKTLRYKWNGGHQMSDYDIARMKELAKKYWDGHGHGS